MPDVGTMTLAESQPYLPPFEYRRVLRGQNCKGLILLIKQCFSAGVLNGIEMRGAQVQQFLRGSFILLNFRDLPQLFPDCTEKEPYWPSQEMIA